MTVLVPIMMFGWVPLTVLLFLNMSPHKAVLFSVIGGVLFLPMALYNLPGLPAYGKNTAIAVSLLIGSFFCNQRKDFPLQLRFYDIPMIVWCFISPIATSLSNGLGLYDGLSSMLKNYLEWGVFYWTGRRYFNNPSYLRDICRGIIIGGLLYVPLILFELRMSPQLSNIIYGVFPHSWIQMIRYGGYRPIVFMQHPLMVSLWMAVSFTISFWVWRNKEITKIFNIRIEYVVLTLFVITILCKSANGWSYLVLGSISLFYFKKFQSTGFFQLLLFAIPFYIIVRFLNIIPIEYIQKLLANIFDSERISSLVIRLTQENLFGVKILEHPLFGWGWMNRAWPVDQSTGANLIQMVDSLSVIVASTKGFFGLASLVSAILIGAWYVLKDFKYNNEKEYSADAVVLSLVVIIFMIDSLVNGMINPVYILCAGVLVSYYVASKEKGYVSLL